MRFLVFMMVALVVTGCVATRDSASRLDSNVRYEVDESYRKIREYARWNRVPQPVVEQYVPPSYCYRTQADIVCYDDAQLGQDTRLVGYQEPIVLASNVKPSPYVKSEGFFDMMKNVKHARPVFLPDSMMGPWKHKDSGGSSSFSSSTSGMDDSGGAPTFVPVAPAIKGDGADSGMKSAVSSEPPASPAKKRRAAMNSFGPKELIPAF